MKHITVLLSETIENLNLKDDSIIVDCTLGYGGHSEQILKKIKNGFLYAFDQDEEAIKYAQNRLSKISSNFEIIKSNFKNIKQELNNREVYQVDGILFDLGVSSPQLDETDRGFSFHKNAKLDMRMDKNQKLNAKEVINTYSYEQLKNIFYKYGEEKYSASIAKNIVKKREKGPINTTIELADIIKQSVPEKYRRKSHPARKTFQAIRIEVNNELNIFEQALNDSLDLINNHGRICVITFHSLEDKICKKTFHNHTQIKTELQKLPIIPKQYQPQFKLIGNITPSLIEIEENHRARSARLRIIEREIQL